MNFFGILKGLLVQKEDDRTKQLALEVSSSATTNTRTLLQAAQTANRTVTLPDVSETLTTASTTDTFTNKTFDADATGNVLSNVDNANIKAGAAIDAAKIADGSVSNAEFQFLDGVTSNIQTQLNNKLGSVGGLTDNRVIRADGTNQIQNSTATIDDSGNLTGVAIDADGAGNSITNIENADIKAGAAIDRAKLASGTASHVLVNDGSGVMSSEATLAKSRGGSGQDNSSLNFPASGTLATLAGTEQLTNKDIDGGTASNTSRLTLPQNTTVNLAALTRKEGTIAYDTTLNEVVFDNGTSFQAVGSGGAPTGDADSIAFFDGSGNLSSDDTDLVYINYDGNPVNPSGILLGEVINSASLDIINRGVAIALGDGASISSATIQANDFALAMGEAESGGHLQSLGASIVQGQISGVSSYVTATGQSHAHGFGQGSQAIIEATSQSHAFGSVNVTGDGRILSSGGSLAFGDVQDDNFWIQASNQSLAGGRTNSNGGVRASNASISFGENVNGILASTLAEFNYQFGQGHESEAPHVTKFGRYSQDVAGDGSTWVSTDPLFILGNGSSVGSRSNAFQVDKDGRETATASQVKNAIRVINSVDTIDARTDYKIICDTTGTSGNLTLPPGENGLEFIFTASGAGGASYTLVPDGIQTLDDSVIDTIATTVISRIYFYEDVWYGM